jgi:hypothetical protein
MSIEWDARVGWGAVSVAIMRDCMAAVNSVAPDEPQKIATLDGHTWRMFWRSRRLLEAALILVSGRLPTESMIISRSLWETALRLAELASLDTDQARWSKLLGWELQELERSEGLLRQGELIKRDRETIEERFAKRRKAVHEHAKRLGIQPSRRFETDDGARFTKYAAKHEGVHWTYLYSHRVVHGNEGSDLHTLQRSEDQVNLYLHSNDDRAIAGAADFAVRGALLATESWAAIVGVEQPTEFAQLTNRLEKMSRALERDAI